MDFTECLRAFLSTDNAVRRQAEAYLNSLMVHRDELPLELLNVLRSSPEVRFRNLACVLLRRVMETEVKEDLSLWFEMSADAQNTVKEQLLLAIEEETDNPTRRRLCDTAATVATAIFDNGHAATSWPDLWSYMYKWVTTGSVEQQVGSLTLFEYLGDYISVEMSESFSVFAEIFNSKLADTSAPLNVRVAAAKAAVGVIVSLPPKSSHMEYFQPLIPAAVSVFAEAVASNNSDASEVLISILIDVVDRHSTAFKGILRDIVTLMCGVAGNLDVHYELRRLTLEFLVTLAEKAPGLCRKLDPPKHFLNSVLPVVMHMLLEYGLEEPTDAEWNEDDGDDKWEDGEGCNIPVAEESLDRISGSLGEKHVLPTIAPIIWDMLSPSHAGTPQWKWRVAGLFALTNCCALFGDDSATNQKIVDKLAELMGHESPRVRHAVLGCLGNFCEYKGPIFQLTTANTCLRMIEAGLKDSWARVRANAARCLTAFTAQLAPDIDTEELLKFTDTLLHALFDIITHDTRGGKEAAMTALSAILDVCGSHVTQHYDLIVPAMKNLLAIEDVHVPTLHEHADHGARREVQQLVAQARHVRVMKGLALEALTIMGKAAGRDVFRADAVVAMDGIVGMLRQIHADKAAGTYKGDDPINRFLWEGAGRIAKVLQDEFKDYLEVVLPPLLDEVRTKVQFQEVKSQANEDGVVESDEEDEEEDENFIHLTQGRQQFKVRTASLEDKESAVRALCQILGNCEKIHLAPYVVPAKDALLPVLDIAGAPFADVRVNAVGAIADVVAAAAKLVTQEEITAAFHVLISVSPPENDYTSIAENFSTPHASAAAIALINLTCECLSAILRCCVEEDEHDMMEAFVGVAHDVISTVCTKASYAGEAAAGEAIVGADKHIPFFHQRFMEKLTLGALQIRQGALQRRAVRIGEKQVHADDYDDEEFEDMDKLEDLDARLISLSYEIITCLFTSHRLYYLPVYTSLLAEIATTFSHPDCIAADRASALYLMIDVIEFCGEEGVDTRSGTLYVHEYLPVILQSVTAESEAVRQACLYGFGVFVETCKTSAAAYVKDILRALEWAMDHPVAGRRSTVEDNAVAAWGKIILALYGAGDVDGLPSRDEMVTKFLVRLPLKHDKEEARVVMNMLCTMLDNRDPDIVGVAEVSHARIAHVLHVLAYGLRDKLIVNDYLTDRVAKSLAQLRTLLSAGDLGHIWSSLNEEDKHQLISVSHT